MPFIQNDFIITDGNKYDNKICIPPTSLECSAPGILAGHGLWWQWHSHPRQQLQLVEQLKFIEQLQQLEFLQQLLQLEHVIIQLQLIEQFKFVEQLKFIERRYRR